MRYTTLWLALSVAALLWRDGLIALAAVLAAVAVIEPGIIWLRGYRIRRRRRQRQRRERDGITTIDDIEPGLRRFCRELYYGPDEASRESG